MFESQMQQVQQEELTKQQQQAERPIYHGRETTALVFAIISLVCSILAVLTAFIPFVGWFFSILFDIPDIIFFNISNSILRGICNRTDWVSEKAIMALKINNFNRISVWVTPVLVVLITIGMFALLSFLGMMTTANLQNQL